MGPRNDSPVAIFFRAFSQKGEEGQSPAARENMYGRQFVTFKQINCRLFLWFVHLLVPQMAC